MQRLADRFELIAPDLRGFGDSPKPDDGPSNRAGPDVHAGDLLALEASTSRQKNATRPWAGTSSACGL